MRLLSNTRYIFFHSLFLLFIVSLSACQLLPDSKKTAAEVKDATLEKQINPDINETSVVETLPLMNNAVKNLYALAIRDYELNLFTQAIEKLERAYEIQADSPQITQLLAEISLHQGHYKQAHYWATIATKNIPSKGRNCSKSWRILAIAAEKTGYYAQQEKALKNIETCLVKASNRF